MEGKNKGTARKNKGKEGILFMRRNMKKILLIITAAVIMAACATTDKQKGYDKKKEKAEMIDKAVSNRDFKISVRTAYPNRGRSVQLTTDFELRVKGDSVMSYLPYFGRAYNIPYGGGKGLNFNDVMNDFKITQPKRNKKHIEFNVKNDEDTYKFYIDVFDNGNAYINVMPQQRESISFNGDVELHKFFFNG